MYVRVAQNEIIHWLKPLILSMGNNSYPKKSHNMIRFHLTSVTTETEIYLVLLWCVWTGKNKSTCFQSDTHGSQVVFTMCAIMRIKTSRGVEQHCTLNVISVFFDCLYEMTHFVLLLAVLGFFLRGAAWCLMLDAWRRRVPEGRRGSRILILIRDPDLGNIKKYNTMNKWKKHSKEINFAGHQKIQKSSWCLGLKSCQICESGDLAKFS